MKLALCNEMFENATFEEVCRAAAAFGYHGIELAPFTFAPDVTTITPAQRREIAETAARYDLEIVGLHWLLAKTEGLHLTHPDQAVRAKTRDYLISLVQFAVDLGGRILVFGSPAQRNLLPGVTYVQALEYAAEVFLPVCDAAGERGAVIAFEPLSRAETDFGSNLAQGLEVIERVNHPQFRLHFDAKAMSYEDEPLDKLVASCAPLIEHVHVNDPNLLGPGMGDLDLAPMVRALAESGYEGYLSVEVFRFDPGPERIAKESAEYLRRIAGDILK